MDWIGSNLRKILLSTKKSRVDDLSVADVEDVKYHQLDDSEKWKVPLIKELIDAKHGRIDIENLSFEEIDETLDFLCTS